MKHFFCLSMLVVVPFFGLRIFGQSPGAYAYLLVTSDLDVKITMNGGKEYLVTAGSSGTRIPVERGENLVLIRPADGGADGYDEIIRFDQPENKVLRIELAEKRKVKQQATNARQTVVDKANEEKRKAEALRLEEERKKRVEKRKKQLGGYAQIGIGYPIVDYGYRQFFALDGAHYDDHTGISLHIIGRRQMPHHPWYAFIDSDSYQEEGNEIHSGNSIFLGAAYSVHFEGGNPWAGLGLLYGHHTFRIENVASDLTVDGNYVPRGGSYSYKSGSIAPFGYIGVPVWGPVAVSWELHLNIPFSSPEAYYFNSGNKYESNLNKYGNVPIFVSISVNLIVRLF